MAGTLFGLGLSQQHDADGRPMSGCLLYLYEANSSTPVIAYRSPGLVAGQELPFPIEADSAGRIPAFWLADGAYRARLTDEDGNVQFDEANILAVGAGTGDIIVPSTPTEALFTTGMATWMPGTGAKTGWVRLNGQTIGSPTSGANTALAACQALYEYLWQNFPNTICPVSSGRGFNAVADWGANKQLTLIDMRGKGPFGLDDMGNAAAGALSGVPFTAGSATTGGSSGGESSHQLTTAELAAHQHDAFIDDQGHRHLLFNHNGTNVTLSATNQPAAGATYPSSLDYLLGGRAEEPDIGRSELKTTGVRVKSSGGSPDDKTANVGGGGAHNNMPLFVLGTWYQKL